MENEHLQKPKNTAVRRVLALIAAIALAGLYIATLVFALMDSPLAGSLLRASLFATFFIPIILYTAMMVGRLLKKRKEDQEEKDPA